jgi:dipeptidyl aminopeptidase/acylaminoacyl peptidase
MDTVGYLDHRRTHLYVFDLAAKSLRQLTSGDFDDNEPSWSPDGTRIAFTSNRSEPDPDRTYNSDIWVVAADNQDKGARLTQITLNPGEDHDAAWSPDGKWIAHASTLDPKLFEYATKHIVISPVPAAGGKPGEAKLLTLELDRMATRPHLLPTASPSTSSRTTTERKTCAGSKSRPVKSPGPLPGGSWSTTIRSPGPAQSLRKSLHPSGQAKSSRYPAAI